MILSIIIPIYNVEQFIAQCIESIYSQHFPLERFEVIAVNDGTPDHSMDIVKRFAAKYSNLQIINQENKGLSVARNTGMQYAKGDYVWFVDSDDWLSGKSLSIVWQNILHYPQIDVFATVLMMQYEKNDKAKVEYVPNPKVKSGRDYMFRNNNANRGACQRYVFKKAFLEKYDLRFMPGVYHEDGEFSNRMLYLADKLMIIPQPVYNYRIRTSGSIMSSRKMKMNDDLVKIFFVLREFAEKYVRGNEDYWPYRGKIYECLTASVLFSRNEIFTREFDYFYQVNKHLIKKEARTLLLHFSHFSFKENITLLQFALFPKVPTQLRQGIKRLLLKLRLYQ